MEGGGQNGEVVRVHTLQNAPSLDLGLQLSTSSLEFSVELVLQFVELRALSDFILVSGMQN